MTKPVTRAMAVNCLLDRINLGIIAEVTVEGEIVKALLCSICGKPLLPGQKIQFDHTQADVHSGPHHYKNLRPCHDEKDCHRKKTKADVQAKAKGDRILQITKTKPTAKIRSKGFQPGHKPMRSKNAFKR